MIQALAAAGFELAKESANRPFHAHLWLPAEAFAKFSIWVAISLPFCRATATIENRWKLAFGPLRVFLPCPTEAVREWVSNTNRKEGTYRIRIGCQELLAGHQFVVDDVESFAIHSRYQAGQYNRVSAIIYKG